MNYAIAAEFELVVGTQETIEITNLDVPSADTINTVRLNAVLAEASGDIDNYLATRYATPLAASSPFIRGICIDIAQYKLAQNNPPEAYITRYNNAIARLVEISKGIMVLLDDNGNPYPKRLEANILIDDRGNPLDDWSVAYVPGGNEAFPRELLDLQDIYRY